MVLVVLKELVVFVGGIFERVKSPNFFLGKFIESKKKIVSAKIHLYLRVLHSIIPLFTSFPSFFMSITLPELDSKPNTQRVIYLFSTLEEVRDSNSLNIISVKSSLCMAAEVTDSQTLELFLFVSM